MSINIEFGWWLTTEMDEDQVQQASFEDAYDVFIEKSLVLGPDTLGFLTGAGRYVNRLHAYEDSELNTFVVNPIIPAGTCALVRKTAAGPETIWVGALKELPLDLFEQSNETHVNQIDYDRIAAKAEATGKSLGRLH